MARIPEEELERIKREVSLEPLVRSFGVKLEKRGADLHGLCPFHNDRSPSLVISPENDRCQESCRIKLTHEQPTNSALGQLTSTASESRGSGLRNTSSTRSQFRVSPDQRSGFSRFAASYTARRFARIATSLPS